MIPFLLIGGGAYLIYEALGNDRKSFDPLDYGLPTKGFRGYRKGKSYLAKGGTVSNSYEDFLLANGFEKAYEIKKDGFTEYRKGRWYAQINTKTKEIEVGKYTHDWSYAETKKDGGIREDSPFYQSDRYTNNLAKFKKFLDDNYALDEVKMSRGGDTSLVGKRIRLIKMENDPRPIEPGTMGTIKHVGGGVYNVNWDNGRTLGVVEGEDQFEIMMENGGSVPTEEEINFMRKFPSGTPRKLLSSDEIKMANKLVKKGYMEKGITDDDKKSVMYEIDYSIRKKYLD